MKDLAYYMALPYTFTLMPDPEGSGYAIKVNELPGCISQGDTPDEAMRRIREAMALWIEASLEDGAAIPEPMSAILAASMVAARQRVEERKGARSASDVVNDDMGRRAFSTRLAARELHRLRAMAMVEGESAPDLARRLILDGLRHLEVKHLPDPRGAGQGGPPGQPR